MPTKRPATKSVEKAAPPYVWRGYVNIDLADKQRGAAVSMSESLESVTEAISQACVMGYKLAVTYAAGEECFVASLTGAATDHADSGVMVSARASAVNRAIAAVLIKLEVSGDEGLSPLLKPISGRLFDL